MKMPIATRLIRLPNRMAVACRMEQHEARAVPIPNRDGLCLRSLRSSREHLP
jgi:hypothetical protein